MSTTVHHHLLALRRRAAHTGKLPKNTYGALVGRVDGPLSDADDNHVFIPLRVSGGPSGGVYRIAFNVESNKAPKAAEYLVLDEEITDADFPSAGFSADAKLSYTAMGLQQAEFKQIENGLLRTVVHSSVNAAELIAAYGITFSNGGGIHDIHYNNGERPGSNFPNRPNQDGALAVYFHESTGQAIRRWIFIKFQSQDL